MGGYIMQLQNFSVNDGDGIRTTVFMAGCPLRCAWCANPEGQTCRNAMTHWVKTSEVVQKIRQQEIFYRYSGGGVTFSGGEATAQPQFLAEMADALYDDGISLALETCGQFDFDSLRPVLQKMDLIFMDLKHPDSEAHRRFTGVGNETILQNLQKTASLDIPLVVRIPMITGVNTDESTLHRAFAFISTSCPGAALELLPYHRYGETKYDALGLPRPSAAFGTPTKAQLSGWEQLAAQEYGIRVTSYK